MMETFTGCSALITGASAGLGTEFAHQLAPYASKLLLVARRLDRLKQLKAQLEESTPGLQVYIYACDLSDESAVQELIDWIYRDGPTIDFIINNAGLGDHGAFAESEWEKVRSMISVNILALSKITFSLLPMLRNCEGASILNVSSTAGFLPLPGMAVYAATKAYVTSFSEALRIELQSSGVTVTALCPGPVETEFGTIAARSEDGRIGAPDFLKVSAEEVVYSGLRAVAGDNARVIPGLLVCAVISLAAALPMVILRQVLRRRGF